MHGHSTKNYDPHCFIFFFLHTVIRPTYMVLFHLFFLLHTTIRPKYMVLFHLFFLLCTTIRPRLGSSLIYFFYLHTTIRQKYMVLFYLFFILYTTIRPKIRVLIDLFLLFAHDHSTKIYGPFLIYSFFCKRPFNQTLLVSSLIYFFYLCTAIRPKLGASLTL